MFKRDIIFNTHDFFDKTLEFDEDGDRISTKYKIINIKYNDLFIVGDYVVMNIFHLIIYTNEIIFFSKKK
jgi:hypothetical protein